MRAHPLRAEAITCVVTRELPNGTIAGFPVPDKNGQSLADMLARLAQGPADSPGASFARHS